MAVGEFGKGPASLEGGQLIFIGDTQFAGSSDSRVPQIWGTLIQMKPNLILDPKLSPHRSAISAPYEV